MSYYFGSLEVLLDSIHQVRVHGLWMKARIRFLMYVDAFPYATGVLPTSTDGLHSPWTKYPSDTGRLANRVALLPHMTSRIMCLSNSNYVIPCVA